MEKCQTGFQQKGESWSERCSRASHKWADIGNGLLFTDTGQTDVEMGWEGFLSQLTLVVTVRTPFQTEAPATKCSRKCWHSRRQRQQSCGLSLRHYHEYL